MCPFKHDKNTENDSENGNKPQKDKNKQNEVILKSFVNDFKRFSWIQKECGIYNAFEKCEECEFGTNSTGILKMHENKTHSSEHTFELLMESFEIDNEGYVEVLNELYSNGNDELRRFACDKCDLKTHSEGILTIHENDSHSNSPVIGDH